MTEIADEWLRRSAELGHWPERIGLLLRGPYLGRDHPCVIVHELSLMTSRLSRLQQSFPPATLHTVAIKANPLLAVLKVIVEQGFGLEAASEGEIALALAAGCPKERIVYDSPAKTPSELTQALSQGFLINANSGRELERLSSLLKEKPCKPKIGLRCNPMVCSKERSSATMVAAPDSKFGVAISEAPTLLRTYDFVSGLHLHIGSQVATLEDLVEGARRVVDLAEQFPQIQWIDIGGGLPTRYRSNDRGLSPEEYLKELRAQVPKLFNYPLITEMGRAVQANCGWAASRVEYVEPGRAILHLGADFALRECYQPQEWWHEISIFDGQGKPKQGPREPVDLYGPLCFSGDRLAQQRPLPKLEAGDIAVIHDVGAYTLSMWSRYCSRPIPEVLGGDGEGYRVLRARESVQDVVDFWSR